MHITAKNLYKSYENVRGGIRQEVLKDMSLEVKRGEKVAVMGPSGSGKTTLLNIIGTLDTPDSGLVMINDCELGTMSDKETLLFRNRTLGFVFQSHHLMPQCTLWENVLLPALPYKSQKKELHQRAEELLRYMGIWAQRHNKPEELSGGECQRAAVARALINQPQLILADEPTGSLDEKNAAHTMELLLYINEKMNLTLLIATHASNIAKKMDTVYLIRDGKLEACDN